MDKAYVIGPGVSFLGPGQHFPRDLDVGDVQSRRVHFRNFFKYPARPTANDQYPGSGGNKPELGSLRLDLRPKKYNPAEEIVKSCSAVVVVQLLIQCFKFIMSITV